MLLCKSCGDGFYLHPECDPSDYCDLCAQGILIDLQKDLAAVKSQYLEVKENRDQLTAANRQLKEQVEELGKDKEEADFFIYEITLKLQQHRGKKESEKDEWFQQAYRLYAKRNADRFDPAYEGRQAAIAREVKQPLNPSEDGGK